MHCNEQCTTETHKSYLLILVGRQFPDKAIDLIDEACATTRMCATNKIKRTRRLLWHKLK
jgi:ATP-dependent Clp protease ATP-binding subunit ClpA